MEVSFFKRKKILQKANTLDLHPLRRAESEEKDGIVTILMPRFKNKTMNSVFGKRRGPLIRITLDATGSEAWNLMDGKRSVSEMAAAMKNNADGNMEQAEERLIKFLFQLYQNNFITFTEILKTNQ